MQNKKGEKIALNERIIKALSLYLSTLSSFTANTLLFPNNRKKAVKPISRFQAYKIIRSAVEALGIQGNITCHSMRKVVGYQSWKDGVPRPLICEIYRHSAEKITKNYLGINQDEIDEVFLKMK